MNLNLGKRPFGLRFAMDPSIYVTPPMLRLPEAPGSDVVLTEMANLLRQTLDTQRELLAVARTQAANQDSGNRWKAFLARWESEFPGVGQACKQVLPMIERAYLSMIQDLTERLREDEEGIDNEFLLGEFLDRYGIRLSQLGNVLSQLGPLADAASIENRGTG
jgi:hypothetical protein